MKFIVFLAVIAITVVAVAWLGRVVVASIQSRSGDKTVALRSERAKRKIAEKALRNIANGTSGLPVLDAQNALDSIDSLEGKELN